MCFFFFFFSVTHFCLKWLASEARHVCRFFSLVFVFFFFFRSMKFVASDLHFKRKSLSLNKKTFVMRIFHVLNLPPRRWRLVLCRCLCRCWNAVSFHSCSYFYDDKLKLLHFFYDDRTCFLFFGESYTTPYCSVHWFWKSLIASSNVKSAKNVALCQTKLIQYWCNMPWLIWQTRLLF